MRVFILYIIISNLVFSTALASKTSSPSIGKKEQEKLTNLLNRGEVLFEEQQNDKAIIAYKNALKILNKYALNKQKLQVLINIANIEYSANHPLSAIKYFQRATTLAKNIKATKHLGYLFSRLSYLYYNNDPNLSKTYIELAIKEHEKTQKLANLAENYYNLSVIDKKLGLLDEAKTAHQNYLNYKKHLKDIQFFKLSEATQNNEYKLKIATPPEMKVITAEYANIQILNKIDGFTYVYETRIGAKMEFKNIEIITRACFKSVPGELPENKLLLEVYEVQRELANTAPVKDDAFNDDKVQAVNADSQLNKINLFNGWMFSSTPSLNPLEHPIYDIRLLNCRTKMI